MITYGMNKWGENFKYFNPITLGFPSRERIDQNEYPGTNIGKNAVIRSGTIIYCDVSIGDNFSTGHGVLIREKTRIGNSVSIGTYSVIEGNCVVGDNVNIQSMVFIPTNTSIGNHVFIGPHATFTNDRYPPSGKPALIGPVLEDYAIVGGNSTILPGIRISKGAAVAAGAVVTRDVPSGMIAVGSPAKNKPIPKEMARL